MGIRMTSISRFLISILLLALLTQGAWSGLAAAMQNRPAGARVTAADGSIAFQSAPVSLGVTVSDVQNLGAATVLLAYDPTVLTPTACQRGSQFGFGLCNLQIDQDDDGTFDAVRFNVLSLSGIAVDADSKADLALISWQVIAESAIGATTPLTVTIDTLADIDGIPISAGAQNGTVTILPAPTPVPPVFLPLVTS